MHSIYNTH